jgi:ribonuclease HI
MEYTKGVKVYTDGACRGNPGPGGWGAVLIHGSRIRELSGGERETTNNRMELTAVIKAFEALKKPVEIDVYSDSRYLVLGMTRWLPGWKKAGWRRASGKLENSDLWQQLDNLVQDHLVHWCWVQSHAGDKYNERADKLAREAIPKG